MQIDDVINNLNKKSTFKIIAFFVLSFSTFQNYGQMQAILLSMVTPNHTCQYNSLITNVSVSKDQCVVNINGSLTKCDKWSFSEEPIGTTMISDYELVCDKKNYADYILIIWYCTSFTGILMGWLSDKYGRKKIAILNLTIETIASILLAVAPTVSTNMVFRFFLGISSCNIFITFVWLIETVNMDFRRFIGSFFWMFGCIGYMVFPLIVYLTKNWRYTQLVSIIPSVLYIFVFFIPESPRWLFVMGKRREAFESMKKICKINKLKIDFENVDIVLAHEDLQGNICSACKSKEFVSRSLLTLFLQLSIALIYISTTVNISFLSTNILLSIFLLGLMETPGVILSFYCLHNLRRKVTLLILGMTGSSLFWISVFFNKTIYWQSIVRILLGCVAKVLLVTVNQTTMVYVSELFPTSHRSFGFVFSQLAGFLSFVGAIYINKLSTIYFVLPMTIYLIFVLTSLMLTYYLLPETKDLPFAETLTDLKELRIGNEQGFLKYMENKKMNQSAPSKGNDDVIRLDENDENLPLIDKMST